MNKVTVPVFNDALASWRMLPECVAALAMDLDDDCQPHISDSLYDHALVSSVDRVQAAVKECVFTSFAGGGSAAGHGVSLQGARIKCECWTVTDLEAGTSVQDAFEGLDAEHHHRSSHGSARQKIATHVSTQKV